MKLLKDQNVTELWSICNGMTLTVDCNVIKLSGEEVVNKLQYLNELCIISQAFPL